MLVGACSDEGGFTGFPTGGRPTQAAGSRPAQTAPFAGQGGEPASAEGFQPALAPPADPTALVGNWLSGNGSKSAGSTYTEFHLTLRADGTYASVLSQVAYTSGSCHPGVLSQAVGTYRASATTLTLARQAGRFYQGKIPCPASGGDSRRLGAGQDTYRWSIETSAAVLTLALPNGTGYRFVQTSHAATPRLG
ncbi:hypothetical protein [Frankia sp. QA3]|uniref:hypothetical protein n=1 Tax=Frankia sp. QA3 TaxID=710111 RepID=UPI0002F7B0F0|nr:hypothetical protein [Frankia sp. QA3]